MIIVGCASLGTLPGAKLLSKDEARRIAASIALVYLSPLVETSGRSL
jgi:hypothetical protein